MITMQCRPALMAPVRPRGGRGGRAGDRLAHRGGLAGGVFAPPPVARGARGGAPVASGIPVHRPERTLDPQPRTAACLECHAYQVD